ncbi:DUF4082 domain-containing protein [Frankia sp. Cas3]|uniref:DUF4082 domain-containing protein n=1 Tax=Frankia sp. Cas3 TaxID=3073926 RepID=UPI002AD43065|nr:DUF4082 domain-containing protein [Frankia sp. Cas3]
MSISSREDPLSSLLTVRRGGGYRQLVSPLSSRLIVLSVAVAMLMALSVPLASRAHAADPCGPPVVNPIACENTKTGSPQSEWDTTGTGDDTIQGFSTDISVNAGSTVHFKIKTSASAYRIDIYRLGWYGGDGARKMATVNHSGVQSQPACLFYTATNLTDCGNWAESTSWAVPGSAVSGVYAAKLTRTDTNANSHIVFVVRNDTSHSDVLYQTSDTTWQAYNSFGGASLYPGPIGRAYKVSYNRPFTTRGDVPDGRDFVFANEYPMIRFLERNGYDVSYASGVDTDRYGSLLTNHKTFLSVGHDEYWSGQQRANVEAARDAGVNLAFFSGNEVYWKTRWEPSTEGSSTPYRTMVTYKETYLDVVDPQDPPIWTGTWRDPRKSPPADGGRPENALTGTGYMANNSDLTIMVPAADGKMRFWRNTSIASLAPGASAALSQHSIGYESDEDLDNGSRPAGLVQLSTTTGAVSQYLQDYGTTVAPGTTTHHLTLYRAASGALVFGAGTIQFPWGLDGVHDGTTTAVNASMQQATVNLLADMGAQPATLMAGMIAATASTDHTPPSISITSPTAGATVTNGSQLTVTGTAADSAGAVGGVEVSIDGGTSWHPATGRGSWTYTGTVHGLGAVTVKARAADDSANISAPVTVSVNVTCPCVVFGSAATPKTPAVTDTSALELGVRFTADVDGWVTGVRFYKGSGNTGTHTGTLWSAAGTQLATATFTGESASGWQQVSFAQPVQVTKNTAYVASYWAPAGHYAADAGFFEVNAADAVPLHATKDSATAPNGVYRAGGTGFPTSTYGSTNYWVDPVFTDVAPPDVSPPLVTSQTPLPASSSVAPTVTPTAVFNEPVQPATITFTVAAGGQNVAGSVGYDASTRTATFTPAAALANGTTYTVTVSGVRDITGNVLAAPVTWTFTTVVQPSVDGLCPCGIWSDAATPANITEADTGAVELGVKFRSDEDGKITGIRFYKGPANIGTHTGTLWSSTGTQLATGTFTGESSTGWETLTFATPVSIVKNTTYIASYHTTTGRYSTTANQFASGGVDNPPLHALANGADGANGVYIYGTHAFPSQPSTTNYWVDVVLALPPDVTPPTIASASPGTGANSVPATSSVKATFSERVTSSSIVMTLTDAQNNSVVASTVTYDVSSKTVTLAPTATLASGHSYTVSMSGASDPTGNTMAPVSWSFTTSGLCPCSIFETTSIPATVDSGDTQGAELGVHFTADVNGWVTGLRFYKSAANTGTHVGTLWTNNGTALATATFTNESASGWQQVSLSAAVAVTAGTTYVASYHAPNGHYSATGGILNTAVNNAPLHAPDSATAGGNGLYLYGAGGFPDHSFNGAHYWMDVVFSTTAPPDVTPPAVAVRSPLGGASSVPVDVTPQVTFTEAVTPSTVTMTVSSGAGSVSGSAAYDAATLTETFTPAAALAPGTQYTVTVSGAKDAAGNTMSSTNWTFITASASSPTGPFSLWSDSTVPGSVDAGDANAAELGVQFIPSVNGQILGVRFYKSVANTGTHTGTLWSSSGTALATATFTGESTTGWQEVHFSTPVTVTAGNTYVVSYHTNVGHYAATGGYFLSSGLTSGPLTAPSSGSSGGNGVYTYSAASAFPTGTYNAANYWVDVVFDPTS